MRESVRGQEGRGGVRNGGPHHESNMGYTVTGGDKRVGWTALGIIRAPDQPSPGPRFTDVGHLEFAWRIPNLETTSIRAKGDILPRAGQPGPDQFRQERWCLVGRGEKASLHQSSWSTRSGPDSQVPTDPVPGLNHCPCSWPGVVVSDVEMASSWE